MNKKIHWRLPLMLAETILIFGALLVLIFPRQQARLIEEAQPTARNPEQPFYGMHFVYPEELATVRKLGVDVVLRNFRHDGSPEEWLAYLDAAQAQEIRVVAWLWPEGWELQGDTWEIDAQAELFLRTMAAHPALLAVYALHEPYWQGCFGCGYTTVEQQALYRQIKEVVDVPVWSAVDSMAFWTERSDETAFAPGVCDYCETWYYPFREDGSYEREVVIAQLHDDLALVRALAPEVKVVWSMQAFAQGAPEYLRMPTEAEMRDLAALVYGAGVDGALWYPWNFNSLYDDTLSQHAELHQVIRDIFEEHVLLKLYLPFFVRPNSAFHNNFSARDPQ
jgi:hypothetical protein